MMYPSVIYDTQIYQQDGISGGGDDSESDWELTSGAHILSDSEPPSDSSSESDEEDEKDENKSMVVSKAVIAPKKIKTRAEVSGGSSWSEISACFIDYLSKTKLPV